MILGPHFWHRVWLRWRLWQGRRQGLRISRDCRLTDWPNFGSEPYLITIGRHVTIAPGVIFITHDGGTYVFREDPHYRDVIKYGPIVVYDNCMIGARVTILPGVTIGPNSVVGAGSVVVRKVPADTVVAGNPARILQGTREYAAWALARTPEYNRERYRRDKRAELQRLFPPVTDTTGAAETLLNAEERKAHS